MFDPVECEVCSGWLRRLNRQLLGKGVNRSSHPFLLMRHRWQNFAKRLRRLGVRDPQWADPDLPYVFGFRTRPCQSSGRSVPLGEAPPPSSAPPLLEGAAPEADASFLGFTQGDSAGSSARREASRLPSSEDEASLPTVDHSWCLVRGANEVRLVSGDLVLGAVAEDGSFHPVPEAEVKKAQCPSRGVGFFFRKRRHRSAPSVPSFEVLSGALFRLGVSSPALAVQSSPPSSSVPGGRISMTGPDLADSSLFSTTLAKGWEKLTASEKGEGVSFPSLPGPKYQTVFGPSSAVDQVQSFLLGPPLSSANFPGGLGHVSRSLLDQDQRARARAAPLVSVGALLAQLGATVAEARQQGLESMDGEHLLVSLETMLGAAAAFNASSLMDAVGSAAQARLACRRAAAKPIPKAHARELVAASPWCTDILPRDAVTKALQAVPQPVVVRLGGNQQSGSRHAKKDGRSSYHRSKGKHHSKQHRPQQQQQQQQQHQHQQRQHHPQPAHGQSQGHFQQPQGLAPFRGGSRGGSKGSGQGNFHGSARGSRSQ